MEYFSVQKVINGQSFIDIIRINSDLEYELMGTIPFQKTKFYPLRYAVYDDKLYFFSLDKNHPSPNLLVYSINENGKIEKNLFPTDIASHKRHIGQVIQYQDVLYLTITPPIVNSSITTKTERASFLYRMQGDHIKLVKQFPGAGIIYFNVFNDKLYISLNGNDKGISGYISTDGISYTYTEKGFLNRLLGNPICFNSIFSKDGAGDYLYSLKNDGWRKVLNQSVFPQIRRLACNKDLMLVQGKNDGQYFISTDGKSYSMTDFSSIVPSEEFWYYNSPVSEGGALSVKALKETNDGITYSSFITSDGQSWKELPDDPGVDDRVIYHNTIFFYTIGLKYSLDDLPTVTLPLQKVK